MSTPTGIGGFNSPLLSALNAAQTATLDAVVALDRQLGFGQQSGFATQAAPRPAPRHDFLRPAMPLDRALELIKELVSTLSALVSAQSGASNRLRGQLLDGLGTGLDLRAVAGSSAAAASASSFAASAAFSSGSASASIAVSVALSSASSSSSSAVSSSSSSSAASSSELKWDANPFKEKVRNDACRGSSDSPTNLNDSPHYALAILHAMNTKGGKVDGKELKVGDTLSGVTNVKGKEVKVDKNHVEGKAMSFEELAGHFRNEYGIDAKEVTVKDKNGVEMKALQLPNGKLFADARGDGLADKFDANLDGMAGDIKKKFGVGIEEYSKAYDELKSQGVDATPREVFEYARVKEEMKKAQAAFEKEIAELQSKLSATMKKLGFDVPEPSKDKAAPAASAAVAKPPPAYQTFDPRAWAETMNRLPAEPRQLPQWLGEVATQGDAARFTQGGGLDYFMSLALQAVVFATLDQLRSNVARAYYQ